MTKYKFNLQSRLYPSHWFTIYPSTLCLLRNIFHNFLSSADLFSKLTFPKNYFRISCLVPDQDGHLVGPDLSPTVCKVAKVVSRQQKLPLARKELIQYESVHEISNNVVCATSKGSDQLRIRAVWSEPLLVA